MTSTRGRTKTHAVTSKDPNSKALVSHVSTWNPLASIRRKYRRTNNYTVKRSRFKSIFHFWPRYNHQTNNFSQKAQYTKEQIAAEIRREFSRSGSPSPSTSRDYMYDRSPSEQQTIFSRPFDSPLSHRRFSNVSDNLISYKECQMLNQAYKSCPIIYSDLYFKHGLSLNAKILEYGSLTQLENGTVYQRSKSKYTKKFDNFLKFTYDSDEMLRHMPEIRTNYMPLYLSDDIKTRNFRALLIDCNVNIDRILINNQDFKYKCIEKLRRNETSFDRYNGMIRLESGEIFEEYFIEKSFQDCYSRVQGYSIRLRRIGSSDRNLNRKYNSSLNLNAITYDLSYRQRCDSAKRSPILNKALPMSTSMLDLLNIDKLNLANKSPETIEKILLRRQRIIDQIRISGSRYDFSKIDLEKSLENVADQNGLMLLEPLLLMQELSEDQRGKRARLKRIEQQKITRITIGYTMAFFLLAIVTFYIIYFT